MQVEENSKIRRITCDMINDNAVAIADFNGDGCD
jgi:hypothetical protein